MLKGSWGLFFFFTCVCLLPFKKMGLFYHLKFSSSIPGATSLRAVVDTPILQMSTNRTTGTAEFALFVVRLSYLGYTQN